MSTAIRAAGLQDYAAVCDLLRTANLPLDGLSAALDNFVVAADGLQVVAVAGLELYDDGAALLRSVAVAPTYRGMGLGGRVFDQALSLAKELGVRDVYLLTDSAQTFFERRGFTVVSRAAVPSAVRRSVEFTKACPESATVMHREAGFV